ncbi:MAG: IS1380 family transposase [Desulfobaccales bacterium]
MYPALSLAFEEHQAGASQSMLSRLENDILGNAVGLEALDGALTRATDALLKRKNKKRLIIDLDSTEDPAPGKQEGVAYHGHFGKNCVHPLFAFTSEGDCLGARLRPGNVHAADGALEFIKPLVERYRPWFKLFGLRGDAAFDNPETYKYGEEERITYFITLPGNANLMGLLEPHLSRPVGRPPKNGIQVKVVDLQYQAKGWHKPRRVVAKIKWRRGKLFPRLGFVVTNSRLPAGKVIKVYNGRGEVENQIKEGKNTLRWDKTSCQRFEANQARWKMGVLAYNLLPLIRQFYVWGEEVKWSSDWLSKRLIKVGARVSYHARRWYVQVVSAFPLAHHYRAVLGWGL